MPTKPKSSKSSKSSAGQTICYTGSGAKPSGKHTDAEFLKAMHKLRGHCGSKKAAACPADVDGWIDWSGAERSSSKKCNKMIQGNRRIAAAAKVADRDANGLRKCIDAKCKVAMGFARDNATENNLASVAVCAAIRCPKASAKLAKSSAAWGKK